jgi:eukaryotic-like serine/threonine-protein kinase
MAALLGRSPSIGDLLAGRYRLGVQIGTGATGLVFRARDTVLGRDVAVKVLHSASDTCGQVDGTYLEEARAAAGLTHPNVARTLDTGLHAGHGFIAMELVEGGSLADLLLEAGRLKPGRAVEIAIDLADALSSAHAQGIVHCDVKPRNVLLTREGVPKLVDFGVARTAAHRSGNAPFSPKGTAAYVAPEQAMGRPVDGRADLYALGAVLYEMLAGRPPFTGESFVVVISQRLVADPTPLGALRPGLPGELTDVVALALAREPDHRFRTADQFKCALVEATRPRAWHFEAANSIGERASIAFAVAVSGWRRARRMLGSSWHAACTLTGRP